MATALTSAAKVFLLKEGKGKKDIVLPVLIIGGLAVVTYFLLRKGAAATEFRNLLATYS